MIPLVTLLLMLPPADTGPANAELLRQAEQAFRLGVEGQARVQQAQRHFARAAELFGALEQRGVRSPGLYLNLGNADFLAGRPAHAVWAYQCGLRLDPNHTVLRKHLEQARSQIHYPSGGQARPETDRWPVGLPRPTPRGSLITAAIGYTLACFLAPMWLRRRTTALLASFLVAVTLLAGSLLALRWLTSHAEFERAHPRVVVVEETPLYRGNGTSYPAHPDLPLLPRGVEARQLMRRGGWLQVQLTSGEVGWLPVSSVLTCVPGHRRDAEGV